MSGRLLPALLRSRSLLCQSFSVRSNSAFSYSRLTRAKCFSSNSEKGSFDNKNEGENEDSNLSKTVGTRYKLFREKDSTEILDVDEERDRILLEELVEEETRVDPYADLNLERGSRGVFDIEDLVDILRKEGAQELFVVAVPPEFGYVEQIVIVTAKSSRHIHALAGVVRKIYKLKRKEEDLIPRLEGKESNAWAALDLGNIALHIFSKDERPKYDLETLWSVGQEYDELSREASGDAVLQEFNAILAHLQPADINDSVKTTNPK